MLIFVRCFIQLTSSNMFSLKYKQKFCVATEYQHFFLCTQLRGNKYVNITTRIFCEKECSKFSVKTVGALFLPKHERGCLKQNCEKHNNPCTFLWTYLNLLKPCLDYFAHNNWGLFHIHLFFQYDIQSRSIDLTNFNKNTFCYKIFIKLTI